MAGNPLTPRRISLLCVALVVTAGAFAQTDQRVIPASDPAYRTLERLFLEVGLSVPFQVRPSTTAEFQHALRRVDFALLSPAGKRAYDGLVASFDHRTLFGEEGTFAFDASPTVSIETYAHVDPDVAWQHGYQERTPVFDLPIEFWLFDRVYGNITATLREEHRLTDDPTNYTNLFSLENGFLEADWYWPFRAFFSVGGPNWYVQFGRDTLSLGNGTTGNLLLSDHTDFHDFLLFTGYWDRIKFTTAYMYLEPWLTPAEQVIWDEQGLPTRLRDYKELYKALFFHRFDFKILKRINFSFTEAIMFGTKYPQIRDFNPLMVFHNWFEYERSNDSLEFGLEINPYKYVNIHGQFFINESQTAYEEEGGGGRPKAWGYLAGAEAAVPLGPGYIEGGVEWVKTDPWLYNRDHPLLQFTSRRRIWSYIPPDGFFYYDQPLGYFLGPDAILLAFDLGYDIPGLVRASAALDIVRKGEMTARTPYMSGDYHNLVTPTGISQDSYVLHFHADATPLALLPLAREARWFPHLGVGVDLYHIWVQNLNHVAGNDRTDWQFAASLSVTF